MTAKPLFLHLILGLALAACIFGLCPKSATADEPAEAASRAGDEPQDGKLSLIEVAPELFYTAKRYSKFYGDANTAHGNILERSNLLGNVGGARDYLVDHGLYVDLGVTQFLQSNVAGGERSLSGPRYSGSTDLWMWFDTGKSELWPGGALFMHGEGRWNRRIDGDVGSLLPANFDTTMPDGNPDSSNWALSEWYFMQGLPADLLAAVGKIDMAAWADTNEFANRERSQFAYTGLVSNAIAGVFFPYTTLGAWLTWSPSKAHTLTGVYGANDTTATETGFSKLDDGDNSYALQYIFATDIANRPGRYLLAGAYSTTDVPSFAISERHLIGELIGAVPIKEESSNYAVLGNFTQYLWVEDGSAEAYNRRIEANPHSGLTRHSVPPVGFGIFGRAGWAPDDRNTIDQFYSLGIGGYGMLIPGRDDDQWGIGWAGSHISDDLRDINRSLRAWEHAGEVFYNFSLTPAAHLSLNSQVIRPASKSADTAFTLGARLQLDF